MTVLTFTPEPASLAPSRPFALACMGVKDGKPPVQTLALLASAEAAVAAAAHPRVCYAILPLRVESGCVSLDGQRMASASLARTFAGCTQCAVFAATLGIAVDRAISVRAIRSPAEALAMDAAANALIEAVCDTFCGHLAAQYGELTMRFSPGYGDLALKAQGEFLSLLDAPRRIGVSLTEGGMMVPVKSVSAVVGIRG